MPTNRRVVAVHPLTRRENAPGFSSVDLFSRELPIEPFLVFTEFVMDRPIFGPHPHAGMTVVTYMLPDSAGAFTNRDSFGDHSRIEPGGLHATQAGAGIMHDEVPEHTGTPCHGMQLWIDHAPSNRLVPPRALHAAAADVPERTVPGGRVRVVLGSYADATAAVQLVTDVRLLDITLDAEQTLDVPAAMPTFADLLRGELDGVAAPALVVFDSSIGDQVVLRSGATGVTLLLASGTPHGEPIVYGGPFVASSAAQLTEMRRRFATGAMGALAPLPA